MRTSLESVREEIGCLARGVSRDSLSLVPVSLAATDDDVVAVATNVVACRRQPTCARAQTNTPAENLHSNSGSDLIDRFSALGFESRSPLAIALMLLLNRDFSSSYSPFRRDSDRRVIDVGAQPAGARNFS